MTNTTIETVQPFNEQEWFATCRAIAKNSCCGGSHLLFVENFSEQVDQKVATMPSQHRTAAIALAAESFDYGTKAEREAAVKQSLADGDCRHGLSLDCCPLGCGDM